MKCSDCSVSLIKKVFVRSYLGHYTQVINTFYKEKTHCLTPSAAQN